MPLPRGKTLAAYLLAAAWLVALAVALWWFQGRYVRSFNDQLAVFSGEQLRLPPHLAGPGAIRLVHFWDPACPCNTGNQTHLAELMQRFSRQGVTFYVLQKPGSSGQLPAPLAALRPIETLAGTVGLPASPAVAIWDTQGQLAYFGPYSAGLTCNSSNSFIEPVIEALLAGRQVRASNAMAVGCFCEWNPEPGEQPLRLSVPDV